ncbi:MAG: class I SAM-dependent methyltransferase [Candidatus Diapherotrites archaeon]|nr:class I SAM-dependent methyltransferase [Candidatus Diapherotrites archaeon]
MATNRSGGRNPPHQNRREPLRDGAHVPAWEKIHDAGLRSPQYPDSNPDLLAAREMLAEAMRGRQHRMLLDVGAGEGRITSGLRGPGIKVISLEPTSVRQLPHQVPQFAVRGIAEALPFAKGSFDTVLSAYALEYANREKAVREIRRALAPGGKAVLLLHKPGSVYVRQLEGIIRSNSAMVTFLERIRGNEYETADAALSDAAALGTDETLASPTARMAFRHYFNEVRAGKPSAIERTEHNIKGIRAIVSAFERTVVDNKRLFPNGLAVKSYFGIAGFNVAQVKTVRLQDGRELGYAVLLQKK